MSIKSRLAKAESRMPKPDTGTWAVIRADGSAYLRMEDGSHIEADPAKLRKIKIYIGEEADPDNLWDIPSQELMPCL